MDKWREMKYERADWKVLKWSGQEESMSIKRLSIILYESYVEGRRDRGRPCMR